MAPRFGVSLAIWPCTSQNHWGLPANVKRIFRSSFGFELANWPQAPNRSGENAGEANFANWRNNIGLFVPIRVLVGLGCFRDGSRRIRGPCAVRRKDPLAHGKGTIAPRRSRRRLALARPGHGHPHKPRGADCGPPAPGKSLRVHRSRGSDENIRHERGMAQFAAFRWDKPSYPSFRTGIPVASSKSTAGRASSCILEHVLKLGESDLRKGATNVGTGQDRAASNRRRAPVATAPTTVRLFSWTTLQMLTSLTCSIATGGRQQYSDEILDLLETPALLAVENAYLCASISLRPITGREGDIPGRTAELTDWQRLRQLVGRSSCRDTVKIPGYHQANG